MRAETTFDLVGDLIGVDAIVIGPTGSVEVQLILDTAAVMTTLVHDGTCSTTMRRSALRDDRKLRSFSDQIATRFAIRSVQHARGKTPRNSAP